MALHVRLIWPMLHALVLIVHGAVIVLVRGSLFLLLRRALVVLMGRRRGGLGLFSLTMIVLMLRRCGRGDGERGGGDEREAADHSGPLLNQMSCREVARRRSELAITLTEESAIAAAAIAGESNRPKAG